jgi:hypothetical protein
MHTHICTHIHTNNDTFTYKYAYLVYCSHQHTYTHIRIHSPMNVHTKRIFLIIMTESRLDNIDTHIHAQICIHTHIYTYMHTYAHKDIFAYAYVYKAYISHHSDNDTIW